MRYAKFLAILERVEYRGWMGRIIERTPQIIYIFQTLRVNQGQSSTVKALENMGLLSKNNNSNDDDEPKWQERRIVAEFERVTQVLHFMDGQTRDITYDIPKGEDPPTELYKIRDRQSLDKFDGTIVLYDGLKIDAMRLGVVHRDSIPYIDEVMRNKKVLVMDGTKVKQVTSSRGRSNWKVEIPRESKWEWVDNDHEEELNDFVPDLKLK